MAFLIILAGVLWGSMGIFVRRLNAYGLDSMDIIALRAGVTAVTMFLYMIIFKKEYLKIHFKDLWCFIGTGVCSIAFFNFCYFKAITLTSLSVAAVLLYTAPAIVMVLSYFLFKEKFTRTKLISLAMTFAGCVLVTGIFTDGGRINGAGILCGMGAGLGYALYSIFSRYAIERGYNSLTITFYTFFIARISTGFFADMGEIAHVVSSSVGMAVFCIAFGVLCTVVPYLAYTVGLKYVDNSKAAIIASVEPVTATLLGVFFFRESISVPGILGVLLVLGALVICNMNGEKG